jgi:C-terminal processing protease CtpA/Prc
MFVQIHDNHIRNLVLDIRNNQGGDFEPSRILLSWLISKPIKFLLSSNEQRKLIPAKNNYKGKLYTLINGGTFSSSGILSSYLELTKRGIFIGEEAAGNKNIISGDPIDFELPNTKILAEISTVKYLIRKSFNNGHGVVPAYSVTSTIENILSNKDAAKEFILDLISKKMIPH